MKTLKPDLDVILDELEPQPTIGDEMFIPAVVVTPTPDDEVLIRVEL